MSSIFICSQCCEFLSFSIIFLFHLHFFSPLQILNLLLSISLFLLSASNPLMASTSSLFHIRHSFLHPGTSRSWAPHRSSGEFWRMLIRQICYGTCARRSDQRPENRVQGKEAADSRNGRKPMLIMIKLARRSCKGCWEGDGV